MTGPSWLIDKSALVRLGRSPDAEQWADRIQSGSVYITAMTLLEIGFSARSARDMDIALRRPPLSAMAIDYSTPAIEDRAMAVQRQLAERGQHRAPSISDVLVAATAEISHRIVLHVDRDFELIADLTDQPLERLTT